VEIGGHKFVLGQCKERDQQLQELKQIVESETSHYQWSKQGLNISLLGMQILMNLFLGSSSSPSIIGIKNCTGGYWLVYASFLAVCAVATLIAIRIARKEQGLKQQFGNINIVKSDLILTRKNLTALCSLGFFRRRARRCFWTWRGNHLQPVALVPWITADGLLRVRPLLGLVFKNCNFGSVPGARTTRPSIRLLAKLLRDCWLMCCNLRVTLVRKALWQAIFSCLDASC
jgi:hypothetical protein